MQEKKRLATAKLERERAKVKEERADKERVEYIEGKLKESFGHPGFEASWYLVVKRKYTFVDDRIRVYTNLSRYPSSHPLHDEWDRLARATCIAVADYIYSKENTNKRFKEVQVLSNDGMELAMFP